VRTKNVATLLALVLVALTAASCTGDEQANEDNTEDQDTTEGSNDENDRRPEAMLELQGEPGTGFSGSCAVGDEEPEEISGQVPESFTYELEERPLECEISSDGDIQVGLTVGNVRSVQRISSGGILKLTYKNGSISSVVSSSAGSSRQGSSSSSQGDTSSETSDVTGESRDVSGFDEVELKGVGNLSIEQTGSESLTVEAEKDVIPKLTTKVVNNRLIIGPESNTIHTTGPINYKLTLKDLRSLEVLGTANIESQGLSTDRLAVTISGAGNVRMDGKADQQEINILGSGTYQAEDLQSKEVKINVAGSGSAIVNVSEQLDVGISGVGSVEYIGHPAVKQDVSGAGRVIEH
jgi:hypothetical protein